ncbi:MAG: NUDIX hydrolase [Candidatus Atribacteria bacterium]|nr:NUDIX hydrolase [Candidatus Atribacteria bacterium]
MFFPYDKRQKENLVLPQEIQEKLLIETRILRMVRKTYEGGMERVYLEHPGAVTIVATTTDNRLILIKQFRAPAREWLWEIPAGTLEPQEDILKCAQRELEEETGFSSQEWHYLFPVFLAPGYSSEVIHFFRARNAVPVENAREGDEDEVIYYLQVDRNEALEMLRRGDIKDAKTRIGIHIFVEEQDANFHRSP